MCRSHWVVDMCAFHVRCLFNPHPPFEMTCRQTFGSYFVVSHFSFLGWIVGSHIPRMKIYPANSWKGSITHRIIGANVSLMMKWCSSSIEICKCLRSIASMEITRILIEHVKTIRGKCANFCYRIMWSVHGLPPATPIFERYLFSHIFASDEFMQGIWKTYSARFGWLLWVTPSSIEDSSIFHSEHETNPIMINNIHFDFCFNCQLLNLNYLL